MGSILTRLAECCGQPCDGVAIAPEGDLEETQPILRPTVTALEWEEVREWLRAGRRREAQRYTLQRRLYQRLDLPEQFEERRRLRAAELAAIQDRWREAVAAGEARHPRGLK